MRRTNRQCWWKFAVAFHFGQVRFPEPNQKRNSPIRGYFCFVVRFGPTSPPAHACLKNTKSRQVLWAVWISIPNRFVADSKNITADEELIAELHQRSSPWHHLPMMHSYTMIRLAFSQSCCKCSFVKCCHETLNTDPFFHQLSLKFYVFPDGPLRNSELIRALTVPNI